MSLAERRQRFQELFHADFDRARIARFVLGPYWRTVSHAEQQEFLRLFEDYVILVYSARLADVKGETYRVLGTRADQDTVIVSTNIISPKAAPLKVDWQLVTDGNGFKIADVIVEGISMLATERSEFASVIRRHGGDVSELLSLMREKTPVLPRVGSRAASELSLRSSRGRVPRGGRSHFPHGARERKIAHRV